MTFASSQEFTNANNLWIYEGLGFFDFAPYIDYSCGEDDVINGENVKTLNVQIMCWYPHVQTVSNLNASNPIYLKVDNDYVEVYDPFNDDFDFLMDFNSVVGDQIQINLGIYLVWSNTIQSNTNESS